MAHVHTGMPLTKLHIILFWLLFSLSPCSVIGALAGLNDAGYANVRFRRDEELDGSPEQLNSSGSNGNGGNKSHSTGHPGTVHKQGIAGVVIATLPVALLILLGLRWLKMRQRNKAAADPASQVEVAQKTHGIAPPNRELPVIPHDSDPSSDTDATTDSDETPRTLLARRPSYASTFAPVLPHIFNPDRPPTPPPPMPWSFAFPTQEAHRSNAEATYADSSYFESTITAMPLTLSMPIPTTPTKMGPSHTRRASVISSTKATSPSPSQWLSRSPVGSRPTSANLEDMVVGYQNRFSIEGIVDFPVNKRPTSPLASPKSFEEPRTP